MGFDEWFEEQDYIQDDGCYQEKYLAAKDAWEEQEARIEEVIARLGSSKFTLQRYNSEKEKPIRLNIVKYLQEKLL